MRTNRTIRTVLLISLSVGSAVAQTATSKIVSAANAFLATLDQKQRQSVQYAFDDDAQRARWSNFPTGFVPRGGIALKDMTPAQHTAAMAIVDLGNAIELDDVHGLRGNRKNAASTFGRRRSQKKT